MTVTVVVAPLPLPFQLFQAVELLLVVVGLAGSQSAHELDTLELELDGLDGSQSAQLVEAVVVLLVVGLAGSQSAQLELELVTLFGFEEVVEEEPSAHCSQSPLDPLLYGQLV